MYVTYMFRYIHNRRVYLRYFDDTEMEVLIGEWKHIVAADNLVTSTSVKKTKW